jgi:hypothetical protein
MKTTSIVTFPFTKIFQQLAWSAIFSVVLVSATSVLAQPAATLRGPWFFERSLEPVLETTAGLQDAALLKRGFDAVAQLSAQEGEELIEQFIVEHPSSVWTPSLRANLGRYYVECASDQILRGI